MRNSLKKGILFFAALLTGIATFAQDHMYSQFFNSPVYLNPALNGQFPGDLRMNLIYRNQYTSVPGGFNYITASVDYNIPRFGGGVGLLFTRGSEGAAGLVKNNIAGVYSYSVGSEDFVLSFGLQAGITNRSVNYGKLVFSDQIDPQFGYVPGTPTAAEPPLFDNRYYFDAGAGINLVISDFNIGGALQHINRPNESFTGIPAKLPMRITAHASYRLDLNPYANLDEDEKSFLIPSVILYKQASAQSINAGMQFKRRSINAGLWYRTGGSAGPSAVVLSLIFDIFVHHDGGEKLRLGVSHDAPFGGLNYSNTSGSSEGSIGYETTLPSRSDTYRKFEGSRRCYDFY
ncbi:PorP/SprF family type IX secretion system membrane protein [Mucilaginibacter sp. RCC_168]|uniref:PorP/SprF family type IX secretion system membrane protein n=1 Tax=unclassified Mucilaginibacter TaxID=2617802 RepID=UPI0035266D74